MAFWKMGIKQDLTYTDILKGESIWNNLRAPINTRLGEVNTVWTSYKIAKIFTKYAHSITT